MDRHFSPIRLAMRAFPSPLLAASLLLLTASASLADIVITTDGRILDGAARFEDASAITVVQRTGPNVRLELSKVLLLQSTQSPRLKCGVRLTSGSVVAATAIVSLDDRNLRVLRGDQPIDIPTATVAEIIVPPTANVTPPNLPPGQAPGVLLAKGDFFEGDIDSLAGGRVVVSSALFGDRTFVLGDEVVALRLRPIPKSNDASQWRIVLVDGSVARPDSIGAEKGRLMFTDPVSGPTSVPRESVMEMRAPASRTIPLAPVSPTKTLPSGLTPALRFAAPWEKPGDKLATGPAVPLSLNGRADATLDLGDRFSAVYLRAGLPVGHLPGVTVRVSVLLDGVRLFRSAPMTATDDPLLLAIPATGKKTLTLRAEVEGGGPAEIVFDAGIGVTP